MPEAVGVEMSTPQLTRRQFEVIRDLVYDISGIDLRAGKEGLVQSRLSKRLRKLGLADYDDYLALVESDSSGEELSHLIDLLTTNKTSFFREAQHLDYLAERLLTPAFAERKPVRIWSAGCSSGEEPYSIAMVAKQVPGGDRSDLRILATDLSTVVLARAKAALYEERHLDGVTPNILREYFQAVKQGKSRVYRVRDDLRAQVKFARLNLMDAWPMKGPFDAIFCRNVMIYFDKETQERLVSRFAGVLAPGGHLFVGHSESLSGIRHGLRYVRPAVYAR